MPVFQQRLSDSNRQLYLLLDKVMLSPAHLKLNAQTNHLFDRLPPIFNKQKQIIGTTIGQYDSGM